MSLGSWPDRPFRRLALGCAVRALFDDLERLGWRREERVLLHSSEVKGQAHEGKAETGDVTRPFVIASGTYVPRPSAQLRCPKRKLTTTGD